MMCSKKQVFLVATFFLFLGVACYAFFYPNKFHSIHLGDWRIEFYKLKIQSAFVLAIIYTLTSYCHIIFMTLYSVLITDNLTMKGVLRWSLFWGIVDSLFEIMQLKEKSENNVDVSADFWILNNINRYLESGHFDIWDIVVIWLGVLSVNFFWEMSCRKLRKGKNPA